MEFTGEVWHLVTQEGEVIGEGDYEGNCKAFH